jgi:uncharacterized protein (DUF58 family)
MPDSASTIRPSGWRSALRRRMRTWALRRQGVDALPLTLRSRRLYILPTRTGLAFGGLLAVAFIAGMNYGSGLAMLLTFWLTGFAIAAMLRTHRSMAGLQVRQLHAEAVFAGQPVPVQLQLEATLASQEFNLTAGNALQQDSPDRSALRIHFPAAQRGLWTMPPLKLSTRAPFGLFRTWTWLAPVIETEIYPHPAGGRPMPEVPSHAAGATASGTTGLDELSGLRPFREGDSPKQVAWKAYAREAPLLVREYHGNAPLARIFDYASLPGIPTEQRLSQLCEWVLRAAARGERYRLHLPDGTDLNGSGPDQRSACLSALARYHTVHRA